MAKKPARRFKLTFIRNWRNFRGLSQEALAERIHKSVGLISQLENGHTGYTQETLEDLAIALKCEPYDLIRRDPKDSKSILDVWQDTPEDEKPRILRMLRAMRDDMAKIILICAVLISIGSDLHAAGGDFCKKKWPGDFRMQKYCITQEDKGLHDTYAWMFAYGAAVKEGNSYSFDKKKLLSSLEAKKPWAQIAGKCFSKWPKQWRMKAYCLDQQTKAALSMGVILDP